ncbi:hypothetical protein AMTR_s00057p00087430 [Amborella trichopoda]|uniref:DYW domain-containing protein n=1 Tax=Amborella trichopoda TaxID=13333 RepID=U5CU23_AMBTC|nr:hypothetical protein AMTR_s00057p00087430 [Amborella trichopoda]
MLLSSLIRTLGHAQSLSKGKMLHANLITSGFPANVYINNHLMSMYVRCGCLNDAHSVFDQMAERNLISWTGIISGYSQHGLPDEALELFQNMVFEGFYPNDFTYVGLLSACAQLEALNYGKETHARILKSDNGFNTFLSNSLVNLYAKCGLIEYSSRLFDEIPQPNFISWTSIIAGFCQSGEHMEALRFFSKSQEAGIKVNEFTSATILGSCAGLEELSLGQQIHVSCVKCGLLMDGFVGTGLIDMYVKCGELGLGHRAFSEMYEPSLASWTALIAGYAQQGQGEVAIDLFKKLQLSGLKPNEFTLCSAFVACASNLLVMTGAQIHSVAFKLGFRVAGFVGNAAIEMYAKCGSLQESAKVFQEIVERNVVSWNVLITGYAQMGYCKDAIKLLVRMLNEGIYPNLYTYSCVLSVCGDLPAPEWGKQVHSRIIKPRFDLDPFVSTSLIDMYSKCGQLVKAWTVFDSLTSKSLVSWNTMLMAYAHHGFGEEALNLFKDMEDANMRPNDVTFIAVLSACGRVGLVSEGLHYFNSMASKHRMAPRAEHYACVIDLLGRAGETEMAYELIQNMPFEPDKVIWRILLAACKIHDRDLELGRHAAECILRLDPLDIAAYVMLSGIYARFEEWDEVARIRKAMNDMGLKKDPGCSWIELKHKTHAFVMGDQAHPERECIYETVWGLTCQILEDVYVPCNSFFHYDAGIEREGELLASNGRGGSSQQIHYASQWKLEFFVKMLW